MTTKKKTAKRAKGKRKAETSDEVSSTASWLLWLARRHPRGWFAFVMPSHHGFTLSNVHGSTLSVAGSAMVQDVTPGPRKAKGRGK